MILIEEYKQRLEEVTESLHEVGDALNIDALKKRKAELNLVQEETGFWDDMAKVQVVNKELAKINNKLNHYAKLSARVDDVDVLIELSLEAESEDDVEEIAREIGALETEIETLKLETLFHGKYDGNNAILTLHAGAGGTEAQDWTSMLFRMYMRYAERVGYKTTILDKLDGEEAGIKTVTFLVEGENAYGYLKAEKGVHRLVRISPFDSSARRHTSFASLEVMPEVETDATVKINMDDVKVDTYRSGGAGGQHVNKTDSAVRMTHLPTGIVVQCQNERSQIQNREQAMKMLLSKLIERQEHELVEKEMAMKGDIKKIEWGSQIRSYVFCPYTMVKDHRTGFETGNIIAVMDGDLDDFIIDYLKKAN
ncbi:MAG: peptide chain release factor 2 [Clostridia bacterium]